MMILSELILLMPVSIKKFLLRSDGTSVYMTQDLGTAQLRFDDYPGLEKLIYVVGNEQEYHFKVLKEIFRKMKGPGQMDYFIFLMAWLIFLPVK